MPTVTTVFTPTRGARKPPRIDEPAMAAATGRMRVPVPRAE